MLGSYDRTPDFYGWKIVLSQEELQHLQRKAGLELGKFDLILRKRSLSRIIQLKIVGSKGTFTIGRT